MKSALSFLFTIAFLLAAGLWLIGCDNDEESSAAEHAASDEIVTDNSTGLSWQKYDQTEVNWIEANEYCENLELGAYKDWRLPTISELRSLVRGCDFTQTGGSCAVTDDCATPECWDDSFCHGCETNGGPGINGRYWPAALAGEGWTYWTSTQVGIDDNCAWGIFFGGASVHGFGKKDDGLNVRCVR